MEPGEGQMGNVGWMWSCQVRSNKTLQLTANPLRGLFAAELGR